MFNIYFLFKHTTTGGIRKILSVIYDDKPCKISQENNTNNYVSYIDDSAELFVLFT